jgi:hypothetical protein
MFYGSFFHLFFILLVFLKSSQSTNFYDGYERLTVILEEMTKVYIWFIYYYYLVEDVFFY